MISKMKKEREQVLCPRSEESDMKRTLSASALLICLLCGLLLFSGAAIAAQPEAAAALLAAPDGPTIGISHRGDWHLYPENSESAILAAVEAGLGYIAADVSRTKDGTLVLCEKNSAGRMLGTDSEAVADHTLKELEALPLKNRSGGKNNVASGEHLLTAEAMLELAAEHHFVPVFLCDASLAEETAAAIAAKQAQKTAAMLLSGSAKEIKAAAGKLGGDYIVLAEKRSNILFDITGFLSAMQKSGAAGVNLKTTNRYGVIFNQTVMHRFDGTMRAIANTAESKTCGARIP